jgi:hypothetical protein
VRIHRTLSLSHEEQRIIARAALSIRIAFGDYPDRTDRERWKAYEGRHLLAAANLGRDKLTPEQVHGAWDATVTLVAVLENQSRREYWETELLAEETADPPKQNVIKEGGVIGLVAPGTDVCGMLAETRMGQLREAQAALPILECAVNHLGPAEPTEIDEDRYDV